MSVKTRVMPRHVDDPKQILVVTIDELVPIALGIVVGIIIGKMLIPFVLGIAVAKVQRRYIDSMPDGFLYHWLYFSGLVTPKARSTPNALRRRWTA